MGTGEKILNRTAMDYAKRSRILLRMGNKIPMEGVTETKLGAERAGKDHTETAPPWNPSHYTTTKPRHYCRCQQYFADRNLTELSPVRLCQCLENIEVDAHNHPLDRSQGPQ